MPVNVIALILTLCGAGNNTSCRHDMTRCYQQKHADEEVYGPILDSRSGGCFGKDHKYPDVALVYECAMDLGVPFDRPVIPDEVAAAPVAPGTVQIEDIPPTADAPAFDETDPAE